MAKRVFELAKELSVKSKAIVQKCDAEGIPGISNHMSSVSAGLEATIREWFSDAAGAGGTAVETAAKVDLSKVRVARPKRQTAARRATAQSSDDAPPADETSTSTATTTEEADRAADAPSAAPAPEPEPSELPRPTSDDKVAAEPVAAPDDADVETSVPPTAPAAQEPGAETAPPAPTAPAEEPAEAAAEEPAEPTPTDVPAPPQAPMPDERPREAAQSEEVEPAEAAGASPVMNVPNRPKVVKPAGANIQDIQKTKAKLSGPKVVRVEAPDQIEAPRRRRQPTGPAVPSARQRGGAGAGMGPMVPPPEVDDPRSRRNRRRSGTAGGGGGGGGQQSGEGAGRSSRRTGQSGRGGPGQPGGGAFRYQDLLEREERLSRSEGFLRQRRRDQKLKGGGPSQRAQTAAQTGGSVKITAPFSIKDLSAATGVKAAEIVKRLFLDGIMVTANSGIDTEKAQELMLEFNIELEVSETATGEKAVVEQFEQREGGDLEPRFPVVTILGHVDHGKTSLLDRIRNANVASQEAGGITQATSAFLVPVAADEDEDRQICFLDTPGHEAFTEMRSRGASMTDIVILVVAADDGVMPQTIESISHAKAAGVPIIVALNKIDVAGADVEENIQRIYGQLTEHGLNPPAWGGDVEVIKTSAQTGDGIQDLLEMLAYTAELSELSADFSGTAKGIVIESRVQEGRGATANVLVQQGELKVGDFVVAGRAYGRVRDLTSDRGKRVTSATPSTPVQITGIDELPEPGDTFYVVTSLRLAQEAAEQRREAERQRQLAQPKMTLDSMFSQMSEAEVKELLVVLKADVQGSIDAIRKSIEEISTDEIKVRVLHAAVGGVNESDVNLAAASGAIIFGFNVIPSGKARQLGEQKGVELRSYRVIYDIVDDVKKAAAGLLTPEVREEVLGHAEVRQVFRVSKVGMIAGCYVTDGSIERNALIRVTRDDIVIEQDRVLEQLKRFKDDAKEVKSGQECGMKIAGYDDIKEGDILECFRKVEVAREL